MINYLSTNSVNITLIDLLFCCVTFARGMHGDMIALAAFCAWVMLGYFFEERRANNVH